MRVVVVALVALTALATAAGIVWLWPRGDAGVADPSDFVVPGATFPHADVVSLTEPCPAVVPDSTLDAPQGSPDCGQLTARLDDGETVTVRVSTEISRAGLEPGDSVTLLKLPDEAISDLAEQGAQLDGLYTFQGIDRPMPLGVLGAVFVVLVLVVARWRGLAALLSLGVGGLVLLGFVAPALLRGEPPVAVGLVASSATMLVVLYLTHGLSLRTSTALLGTLVGLGLTAVAGVWGSDAARLTGVGDEDGSLLQGLAGGVRLHDLVACGVLIAAFGVLNDVTISQTSAVWELRAADPFRPRRALFGSAMRIGRDHLASTVYTIVFAYAGAALPILLLVSLSGQGPGMLFLSEGITAEVVRTLASAIGLVLAIPATTAVAVLVAPPPQPVPEGRTP
ncbi:YibE/F family protein [Phycicoccus sp. CSK15P-2]|uniref:YibE/F family protein n=1 Tax=Phycicoccus sp. CSK15P-2 TaxID=2807627 RepID=UPI00194DFB85|nr:YibE/F family protein [Phycicoccus sp. CSK15P-2]MBM6405271.1 YibE/F family protein [Phycicoccus sp. CSK15P-2]